MIERSLKRIILIITLALASALFAIFGGVSFLSSANPSPITVSAAEDMAFRFNHVVIKDMKDYDDEPAYLIHGANITVGSYYREQIREETEKKTIQAVFYTFNYSYRLMLFRAYNDDFYISSTEFDSSMYLDATGLTVLELKRDEYQGETFDLMFTSELKDYRTGTFYFLALVKDTTWYRTYGGGEIDRKREIIAKSNRTGNIKLSAEAEGMLKSGDLDGKSDEVLKLYRDLAGYNTFDGKASVYLRYRGNKEGKTIPWKTETYQVDNLRSLSEKYVWSKILQISGRTGLSDFNIIRNEKWTDEFGSEFSKLTETITAANGYTYDTDTYTLTITYNDFNAEQFPLIVNTNDEQHSIVLVRSDSIVTSNGKTVITFDTTDLKNQLMNNFGWEEVDSNFDDADADGLGYIYTVDTLNYVNITKKYETGDDGKKYVTQIQIEVVDENDLLDVDVRLEIQVVPPVEEEITVIYKEYTVNYFSIFVSEKQVKLKDKVWSNILTTYQTLKSIENLKTEDGKNLGDVIDKALNPTELGDAVYAYIDTVTPRSYSESEKGTITVEYKTRSIFAIHDSVENNTWYMSPFGDTTSTYVGKEFIKEHDGYRVQQITSEDEKKVTVTASSKYPDDWGKATVEVSGGIANGDVWGLNVIYTDKLIVEIEYLVNYTYTPTSGEYKNQLINSGFAQKLTKRRYDVRVDEFKNIHNPTETELKAFLGLNDLTVIGTFGKVVPFTEKDKEWTSQGVTLSTVEYIGGIYYIKLSYQPTTIEVVQSTGEYEIISNIPLTSFGVWADSFGYDWSIMALNTSDSVVFTSQGDIARNDLYGYFYVAVFKEQVKNLDTLFSGYGGEGCKTFYNYKEVKGSELYKFLSPDNLGYVGTVVTGVPGQLYRAAEETFKDDSGTYYSYFTYINGASETPYAGNNKSDGFGDHDSAVGNTGQDIIDNVKDWVKDNSDIFNQAEKVLKAILGIVVILIILSIALKFVPSFIKSGKKIKTEVKKNKESKEPKSKG